jgi:predicted kinase
MELVIFIGLQGAGKTPFYRARFAETHALVSKDRLRNNRRPGRRQRQLIEEALQAGQSVVVDNTNPTAQDRAELIELARRHRATVAGYYFESRLEDCLERNRQRACGPEARTTLLCGRLRPAVPYPPGWRQPVRVAGVGGPPDER